MSRLGHWLLAAALAAIAPAAAMAAEEFKFDPAEIEKKPLEIGGYLELRQERLWLNQQSVFYRLGALAEEPRDSLDRSAGVFDFQAKLNYGIATFNLHTRSTAVTDQWNHARQTTVLDSVLALQPNPGFTAELGKKAFQWGKGYAWNPVGFVQRPKDPNEPELAREGYVAAALDLIRNFDGPLQTVAFTPLVVPTQNGWNDDFGSPGHTNPAAKLYFLFYDTDIDLMWLGNGSRPGRYGFDFSRNLGSNLEIHGEWARIPSFDKPVVSANGQASVESGSATSWLLGLRYLTENEITIIAEYYRNGTGYAERQMSAFYTAADNALDRFEQVGISPSLGRIQQLSQGGFGRPNPGRDYAYLRATWKDPFDILYLTPGLTTIVNVGDGSYSISPEVVYTGVKNLELRAKFTALGGGAQTEFGEKVARNRFEFRLRWFF